MSFTFIRSRRLHYLLGTVTLSWILFILFRIIFYFTFNDLDTNIVSPNLSRAFWIGIRFDLRLSIVISLPLMVLTMIPVLNVSR